jgi:hypothetical protein
VGENTKDTPERLKRCANQLGAMLRGRWWQLGAPHVRKAAARALKYRPVLQDLGDTVARKFPLAF